jgi:ribosomal protein S18 acetylase RimI-like enzyme
VERTRKIRSLAHTQECWDGSQLVGLVALYENDLATRKAFITHVGVSPEFRRSGIARRLLEQSSRRLRAAGMRAVELEVRTDNAQALGLYLQLGFVEQRVDGEKTLLRAVL